MAMRPSLSRMARSQMDWITPLSWDTVVTYDAYVNYKLTDNAALELVGTNLSNLYYIFLAKSIPQI